MNILNNLYKKIEDFPFYTAIIPFLFLSIGGITQIIALYSLGGKKYLRFFSASQLFADSIGIFLFIMFFVVLILFGVKTFSSFNKAMMKVLETLYMSSFKYKLYSKTYNFFIFIDRIFKDEYKKKAIHTCINFLIMIGVYSLLAFLLWLDMYLDGDIEFFKTASLLFLFVLLGQSISFYFTLRKYASVSEEDPILYVFLSIIVPLFVTTTLLLFYIFTVKSINNEYYGLPENLSNSESVEDNLRRENSRGKVLYFNDKYIFLSVCKDSCFKNNKYPMGEKDSTLCKVKMYEFSALFKDGK